MDNDYIYEMAKTAEHAQRLGKIRIVIDAPMGVVTICGSNDAYVGSSVCGKNSLFSPTTGIAIAYRRYKMIKKAMRK